MIVGIAVVMGTAILLLFVLLLWGMVMTGQLWSQRPDLAALAMVATGSVFLGLLWWALEEWVGWR